MLSLVPCMKLAEYNKAATRVEDDVLIFVQCLRATVARALSQGVARVEYQRDESDLDRQASRGSVAYALVSGWVDTRMDPLKRLQLA